MALNENAAIVQANNLSTAASDLRSARANLQSYRTTIANSWRASEAAYLTTSLDKMMQKIDQAIRDLDTISGNVRISASEIRKEDEAREAAERAAAEQAARAALLGSSGGR